MFTPAEEALREANPALALQRLQEQVRGAPGDARLRVFLFQLLCVLGQWDRALAQLDVCAQLDVAALPMRATYRDAILCEQLRTQVFAGRTPPLLLGEPQPWSAQLVESLVRAGRGETEAAQQLRQAAFDAAPTSTGVIDGQPFEWIADADMRLGPVLEAVVNGRYCWLPFVHLARLDIESPSDLRDAVWLPASLTLVNGGELVALIPARYPGSEHAGDGELALARRTEWTETAPGVFQGLGQRVLTTDAGDVALMDTRSIVFHMGAPSDA